MPREKLLAAVVRLLETTTIRIGNDEYARDNHSFGLTTFQKKHASVRGGTVTFSFRGKSGIKHAIGLHDKRLAKIVRACQDIPGQQLFEYIDEDGVHAVDSSDVNAYIREISGDDFTAKDFRTWVGTVHCAVVLAEKERRRNGCRAQNHHAGSHQRRRLTVGEHGGGLPQELHSSAIVRGLRRTGFARPNSQRRRFARTAPGGTLRGQASSADSTIASPSRSTRIVKAIGLQQTGQSSTSR